MGQEIGVYSEGNRLHLSTQNSQCVAVHLLQRAAVDEFVSLFAPPRKRGAAPPRRGLRREASLGKLADCHQALELNCQPIGREGIAPPDGSHRDRAGVAQKTLKDLAAGFFGLWVASPPKAA